MVFITWTFPTPTTRPVAAPSSDSAASHARATCYSAALPVTSRLLPGNGLDSTPDESERPSVSQTGYRQTCLSKERTLPGKLYRQSARVVGVVIMTTALHLRIESGSAQRRNIAKHSEALTQLHNIVVAQLAQLQQPWVGGAGAHIKAEHNCRRKWRRAAIWIRSARPGRDGPVSKGLYRRP